MQVVTESQPTSRFLTVSDEKAGGATYTPKILADFVAEQIVKLLGSLQRKEPLRILDPAVGDGELLLSLLNQLKQCGSENIEVHGFETNKSALDVATRRIRKWFPTIPIDFKDENFLRFVLDRFGVNDNGGLFQETVPESYDLIIANPPYVRTQIMGARQTRMLAEQFGLSGRVDLYYAFIIGMARVLKPKGIAGVIVSNRFMTTKSGGSVRRALVEQFNLRHVWDLGDTKLFDAAVLPAVLLMEGLNGHKVDKPAFTSIYESSEQTKKIAANPIKALSKEGIVKVGDGRSFHVQNGKLETEGTREGVWCITTKTGAGWLATVKKHTWGSFGNIGKIRVGVKTCADKVFIRSDWNEMSKCDVPELLKPLTTHHIARRFKPLTSKQPKQILYPHELTQEGRRVIDISRYPRSEAYLERNREILQNRKYVTEAGRDWYEIWVPQDPAAWDVPKLIFRDIAEKPTFWIDHKRSVVNGDCYWLICEKGSDKDLLWLACAIGNSTFIEQFYDYCFHNKLYAGRRRFMTQYVEKFPLPDPDTLAARVIIAKAKDIYMHTPSEIADELYRDLDRSVWEVFGLVAEEVRR